MFTSSASDSPPASSRSTVVAGSSVSRAASTAPRLPEPTTTYAYVDSATLARYSAPLARASGLAGASDGERLGLLHHLGRSVDRVAQGHLADEPRDQEADDTDDPRADEDRVRSVGHGVLEQVADVGREPPDRLRRQPRRVGRGPTGATA